MIDWSTSRICGSSDFISKLLSSKVKWWPDEATGGHGHHLSRIILSICYWFCTGKKYVLCCGFGLKQSSFKVQWWTVVSLALCIVVLAELINNNLSAAAAGRCFVLRCDAEIGIIKEILIIEQQCYESEESVEMYSDWMCVGISQSQPPLSCCPQSESPVPSLLAATFYHTKFLPYK